MLLSLEWLQDYIELTTEEIQQLPELLTQLGHEVEGVTRQAPLDPNMLVGEILEARQHPDAEKLRVCTVAHLPGKEPLEVVCGAHNARKGIKVALAVPGTEIPGGIKIKRTKLRGVESMGMLCSGRELGVSEDHDGILEFPLEWPTGSPLNQYMQIGDTVYELKITPNRADCLSYIGVARDLAAKLKKPLRLPQTPSSPATEGRVADVLGARPFSIRISDFRLCDRFVASAVCNIPAVQTPFWMKKRLEAAGLRAIHFLVDLTNYVMLEYGQPSHAYDLEKLPAPGLEVSTSVEGAPFVTLDGKSITLSESDICIQSGTHTVGLAGVMGSKETEVTASTHSVVFEVARFHAKMIRKTEKRLGLSTEAAFRFERGVNVENLHVVMDRLLHLLTACCREQGLAVPTIQTDYTDLYPEPVPARRIALRLQRAREVIGLNLLSAETCIQHLTRLGIPLLDKTDERMLFSVPAWRGDIEREIDLIEEVLRLEGFDKIPSFLPKMDLRPLPQDPFVLFQQRTKLVWAQLGGCEVITFPFCQAEALTQWKLTPAHPLWPTLRLANPINELCGHLQATQIPTMLKSLLYNRNHGVKDAKLFQVGKVYFHPTPAVQTVVGISENRARPGRSFTHKAQQESFRMGERTVLSFLCDRTWQSASWESPEKPTTYFSVKHLLEQFIRTFTRQDTAYHAIDRASFPFLHPHAAATVSLAGESIGWLGELHPGVTSDCELQPNVVACEIDLERLFELISSLPQKRDLTFHTFPPTTRDMAVLVEKATSFDTLADTIARHPRKKHLEACALFDVYEGDRIPTGKKSLAFSLTFRSTTKTLTDEIVEKELTALKTWLVAQQGVEFR